MTYVISSLVISSLALIFSLVALCVFVVFGRKVFKVFVNLNNNMQTFITNQSGTISQNNNDHDHFKRELKRQDGVMQQMRKQVDKHEDTLFPRQPAKLMNHDNAQ